MKVAHKMMISFFLTATFVAILGVSVVFHVEQGTLKTMTMNHLSTTVQSRGSHIETVVDGYEDQVATLARGSAFRGSVYIDNENARTRERAERKIEAIIKDNASIVDVSIWNKDGIVIASSCKEKGSDESSDEVFRKSREGVYVGDTHSSAITGDDVLSIAVPILLNGKFAGVAGIDFSADEIYEIVTNTTGLGTTGEISLVNRDGHVMVSSCAHNDYTGDKALSARDIIQPMEWVLVAEISERAALEPLVWPLKLIMFIVVLAAPILSGLIGVFISVPVIAGPLLALRKGAAIIGSGNLDHKVGTNAKDEIGQLSRAFDKMTEDLKKVLVSRNYVDNIVSNMADILIVIKPGGKIEKVNKALTDNLGYEEKELIGKDIGILIQDEGDSLDVTKLDELIGGSTVRDYEVNFRSKDGSKVPVLLSGTAIRATACSHIGIAEECESYKDKGKHCKEILRIVCVAKDIAEQKNIENELRKEKSFIQNLVDTAQAIILVLDKDGQIIRFNPYFEEITGYSLDEMGGKNWFETFLEEQDRGVIHSAFLQEIEGEETRASVYPIVLKNGKKVYIEWQDKRLTDDDGNMIGLLAIGQDITVRRQSEKAVVESEQKYRALFDLSRDAIMTLAPPSWRFTSANPSAIKLFKARNEAEFVSKGPWEVSPKLQPDGEESSVKSRRMIEKAMQEGASFFEWTHMKLNGEVFPATVLLSKIELAGQPQLQGTVRDITEREKSKKKLQDKIKELSATTEDLRNTQERLSRSEKLAIIGKLAGIVSHELRNPLGVIKNVVYFLNMRLGKEKDEKVKKHLDILKEEVNVADKIITNILDFVSHSKLSRENADIGDIIKKAIDDTFLQENIVVQVDLDKDLPKITMDALQVRQVFLNLIVNAAQAMPDGGTLKIAATTDGEFIIVDVSDTGCGIDEQHLEAIFEPLFSTKAKGIGLGLSTCSTVIDAHDGEIKVKSEVNKGTTFAVKLPIHKDTRSMKT
jgi:PAS domain S-box-containing protein